MRMFVAVVPPEPARAHLDEFLEPRRSAGNFGWTDPDQFHLTLAFCEQVPERSLDRFVEVLEAVAERHRADRARLVGGGAFPDPARARVLWCGMETGLDLAALARSARGAANDSGIAVDGQRPRPHLTLARMRRPVGVDNWVRLLDGYAGPWWELTEVSLIASYLGQGRAGRPRYVQVAKMPLATP